MSRVRAADEIVETNAPDSFSGVVLRGSLHIGLSQAVGVGCMIGSVIVLSRFLTAYDFGLIAMVGPVLAFLAMFRDLGLLQAVIQKKDLTYGQLNTLFWINMAISAGLTLILVLAAPWIAAFYRAPDLVPLIQVMALGMVITGLGAQHFALMNRQMMFGRMAINASLIAVAGLATSILWALVAPSAWALVAGSILGMVLGAVLVWLWVPWRPTWPAWAPGTGTLFGFGAGVTGFKLANFFSRNLDNILIGRAWGGETLGLYDRAYKLLLFPLNRVAQPLSQVMVPVLSRMQDEPARYNHAFFRVFGLMQLAVLPGVAAATAMAETAVPFLLGAQWAAAAPIFAALGIAGMVQPLGSPTGWIFISQGRTTEMAWWGFASALITCGAFLWGVQHGVVELALAYAGASVLKLGPLWWIICRKGAIAPARLSDRILPVLAAGFVTLGALTLVQDTLPGPAVVRLITGTLLSYAMFTALIAMTPYGRLILAEARGLAFKRLARLPRPAMKGTA
ncbi:MAG: lipopolysaccharide biosynthesis protein [Pseudomonadota bacterium]